MPASEDPSGHDGMLRQGSELLVEVDHAETSASGDKSIDARSDA